jgi:hypothetical protein
MQDEIKIWAVKGTLRPSIIGVRTPAERAVEVLSWRAPDAVALHGSLLYLEESGNGQTVISIMPVAELYGLGTYEPGEARVGVMTAGHRFNHVPGEPSGRPPVKLPGWVLRWMFCTGRHRDISPAARALADALDDATMVLAPQNDAEYADAE